MRDLTALAVCLYLLCSLCAISAVQKSCPTECQCEPRNQVQCQGETITEFPSPIPANTSYLFIYNTKFSALKPSDFEGFAESLTNLNISNSGITQILDDTFNQTRGLTSLSLRGTNVSSLPPRLFWEMSGLEKLLLDRNKIESLSEDTFRGLGRLKMLHLSLNALQTIPAEVFVDLVDLEELSLYGNKIKTLPATLFSKLGKLKTLYLSRNQISKLPEGIFSELRNLSKLSLFGNGLVSLPIFVPMPLEELWLYDNKLTHLKDDMFRNLTQLRLLVLSRNQIRSVSVHAFRGLASLGEVSLKNNRLEGLLNGTFSGLPKLVNISLEHNQLRALPGSLLQDLPLLRSLDLHNNSLSNLLQELLDSLQQAEEVLLAQNPWKCDQDILPLINWLDHRSDLQNISDVICHFPESLKGTPVVKVSLLGSEPVTWGGDIHRIITALVCTFAITVFIGAICWRRRKEKTVPPQFEMMNQDLEQFVHGE
ncbi:hypothetical protein AGOR_G00238820 [Albula goreensis]|uniref:Uncharacterized protein n=1 Tax=Albula goreensis TaxID=1534307 RepID=A0A8T3CFV6_9TELE|nr:hypothetical protein AGOR_G00238820 [Albula goreensis]